MKKSIWGIIFKWILIIMVVLWVKNLYLDFVSPEQIDLTEMVNMKKADLEVALVSTMKEDTSMVKGIYHYSKGEVTVESDKEGDVGIVYIDGEQVGFHIHGRQYFMYGVHIGDSAMTSDRNITFEYNDKISVLNDMVDGTSTANIFVNKKKNECMMVIINDVSNRVVAMTYYNDWKEVSELLNY